MPLFISDRIVFALTAFVIKLFRIDVGDVVLENLHWFKAADSPRLDSNASKRERRNAQSLTLMGGPALVNLRVLVSKDISDLPFTKDFFIFGSLVLILLVNLIASFITLLFNRTRDECLMLAVFSLAVCCASLYYVAKVELQRSSHGTFHLWYICILGTALSIATLMLVPNHVLEFRVDAATLSLQQTADAIWVLVPALQGRRPPALSNPLHLALAASLFAGAIAAFMLAPAKRFARLLWQGENVRPWGKTQVAPGMALMYALRLALLLPLLVVLLQFKPMVAFFPALAARPALLQLLQPGLYLAVAVAHVLVLRPLCQTFLNSGVLEYHQLRHNGVEHPEKKPLMVRKLTIVPLLLGRVSVQLLCLAGLMAGFGSVLLWHNGGLAPLATLGNVSSLPVANTTIPTFPTTPPPIPSTSSAPAAAAAPPSATPTTAAAADPVAPSIPAAAAATPSTPGVGAASGGALEGFDEEPEAPRPATSPRTCTSGSSPTSPDSCTDTQTDEEDATHPAPGSVRSSSAASASAPGMSAVPYAELLVFLAGYLGWWSCLVWYTYAAGTLLVFRLGLGSV